MSEAYDVLYEELNGHKRVSKRAVFVIDADQSIRYRWIANTPEMQPDWEEVAEAMRPLQPA